MSQIVNQFFHSHDQEFIRYFLSTISNAKDLENCKLISREWNEIMQEIAFEIYSDRMQNLIKQEPRLKGLQIMLKAECKKNNKNTAYLYWLFVRLSEKWKVFCHSGYFPLLTGFDSYLVKSFYNGKRGIFALEVELKKLKTAWKIPEKRTSYYSFHTERDLEDSFRICHRTWLSILEKVKMSIGLDKDDSIKEITKGMSKFGGSADIPKDWCGKLSDYSLILQLNCKDLHQIIPNFSELKIPSHGWIYLFGPGEGIYDYDMYILRYFGGELDELNSYQLSNCKPCTPISFRLQVSLPDSLNIKYIPKTPLIKWYDLVDEYTFYYNCMELNTNTSNFLFGYGDSEYVGKNVNLFANLRGEKFMFADGDTLFITCNKKIDESFDFETCSAKISH